MVALTMTKQNTPQAFQLNTNASFIILELEYWMKERIPSFLPSPLKHSNLVAEPNVLLKKTIQLS